MIIKQKSLIVTLVSSLIIALVLVMTLLGYLLYVEIKGEEIRISYEESMRKLRRF